MVVTINETQVKFPSALSEITLQQKIEFHDLYGKELEEKAKEIEAIQDEATKSLETIILNADNACKQFSFFSGIDLQVVQESNLEKILQVSGYLNALISDNEGLDKSSFNWEGEDWEIQPPYLSTSTHLTFGELVDSKQIVQDLQTLGEGEWKVLLRLSAIFLRKKGEKYDKLFAEETGERVAKMKSLPLDIALCVGFFLKNSISLYQKTLQSLASRLSKEAEMSTSTLSNGAGLIS